MAHESFEDGSIAAFMNAHFINVKVDREERPDVDHLYMSALHGLGEQGGWPLTMCLTPDATPFWGGTYFPPKARYGRPGFIDVLEALNRAWHERRFAIESTGKTLASTLIARTENQAHSLTADHLNQASDRLLGVMDFERGGTRGSPKFPNAPLLELLERAYERTGNPDYATALDLTLMKLCLGGIYDHVGGGLCRYSTDDDWLVPHFEKMLYDNGQLIDLLASAWRRTGHPLFRQRIDETIAWMERDLFQEGAGYWSSLDADSGSGEGAFYVWTPDGIHAVLGAASNDFCKAYDIRPEGNWENVSIPNQLRAEEPSPSVTADHLALLRVSRETRPRPATDDKILVDWNALAILGLLRASQACDQPAWLDKAKAVYRYISESMMAGDDPVHAIRQGQRSAPAVASDYASLALAAVYLAQITSESIYLTDAARLLETLHSEFLDQETGLYTLASVKTRDLPLRLVATLDEATPNLHGHAIAALVRLSLITSESTWMKRADDLLARLASTTLGNVYGHASVLNAFDQRLYSLQIVLIGDPAQANFAVMDASVRALSSRKTLLSVISPSEALPRHHPAYGKTAIDGLATVYICLGETCSLPVTSAEAVAPTIQNLMRGLVA